RARDAACTEREVARQAMRLVRRSDEHSRDVAANILRRVASDVVVQGLLAAVKTTRVDRRIERSDPIAAHRRTCSAWRFIARLSAALGFAGASSAARNALKYCGVRVIASCAWTTCSALASACDSTNSDTLT